MANLASAANYINDLETAQLAPNSESLQQRIGGSINYALDQLALIDTRIGSEPGVITGTIPVTTLGTSLGSYTFTGRPVLIVIYSGVYNPDGPHTMTIETTATVLVTCTPGSGVQRNFAANQLVNYVPSHVAGTYNISVSKSSLAGAITAINFAIIEL